MNTLRAIRVEIANRATFENAFGSSRYYNWIIGLPFDDLSAILDAQSDPDTKSVTISTGAVIQTRFKGELAG